MGARLRRSGKAGVVGFLVAIALLGSAWLAYATTAPTGNSYPQTVTRAKGRGWCNDRHTHTHFQFDVGFRTSKGVGGTFITELGTSRGSFHGQDVQSLTFSGNTATFVVDGKIVGTGTNDKSVYTASVTAVDNSPDTISINIHNGSTIYSQSCVVMGGSIKLVK
jgi:hypothetical protein